MRRTVFLGSLLLVMVVLLSVPGCEEIRVTEGEVEAMLDSLEFKLDWTARQLAHHHWLQVIDGTTDSLEYYRGLWNYVLSDPQALKILDEGRSLVDDDIQHRRWELAFRAVKRGQVDGNLEILELERRLRDYYNRFRTAGTEGIVTGEVLRRRATLVADPVEREMAFRSWAAMGAETAEEVARLFRMRNQVARRTGFGGYFNLALEQQGIDRKQYVDLLDRVDSATSLVYDSATFELHRQLGQDVIRVWDLEYARRLSQSRVDRYLPVDSQLNVVSASLLDMGFLLDAMPVYVEYAPAENVGAAYVIAVFEPGYDIRAVFKLEDGIEPTGTYLAGLGGAVFGAHVTQDAALFSRMVPSCWIDGVSHLFRELTARKEWLTRYAAVPAGVADEYRQAHIRHRVIGLRQLLLLARFEMEAYRDPNRDLNKLYWDLFEHIMRLPRHDDLKPWANEPSFVSAPVSVQNDLVGQLIAAQTIAFVERSYGEVVGNPTIAAFVTQNYLRFGSRYPWQELLKRGTDQALNPDHLFRDLALP